MLTWGAHKPFKASPLKNPEHIKTSKGNFKIIKSPGHCFNLISIFHEKKRVLFSTDAFINEKQNVIFNWENANIMMETFKKLIKLNPKNIFLEDGRIITTSELQELLDYWNFLKEESIKLHSQGLSPRKIVKKIFGKESWLKTATGGDMSRENLIRSLLELPPLFKRKIRKK
jgi:hypothetical protein